VPTTTAPTISRRQPPPFHVKGFPFCFRTRPRSNRQAAHAGFQVMLSGHTHGGQICLPGSIPLYPGFGFCRDAWEPALEIRCHGGLYFRWRWIRRSCPYASTVFPKSPFITCRAAKIPAFCLSNRDAHEGGTCRTGATVALRLGKRRQPHSYIQRGQR